MNRAESCRLAALLAALVVVPVGGCSSTTDSLGSRADVGTGTGGSTPPPRLRPITGPSSYPNAYHDVLSKSDTEIANKIATIFAQLFHGDANTQAIFVPVGTDQAYIQDVLHNDIRTEGIGYGMLIAVELDKREEFDRLWNYAKAKLLYTNGASRGYYQSSCDTGPNPCSDPFGMQQFVMSLIFAHDRWGSTASGANADAGVVGQNYEADALALLRSLRHTEEDNGSLALDVTNVFDANTKLVFDMPNVASAMQARPSIEMPGYYDLWAQATGDSFWSSAASAARAYWKTVAHPTTGLLPVRTKLNGTTLTGSDKFLSEAYRAQINVVIDHIWTGGDSWEVDESNRLLQFFASKGMNTYGGAYSLDGTMTLEASHDSALVAANGISALIATSTNQMAFVNDSWNLVLPTGAVRYYPGIVHMLGVLALSGQLRVY